MIILANRKSRGYHDGYRRLLLRIFARRRKLPIYYLKKGKNLFRILDAFKKAREQKIPQKLILVGKTLPLISKKIKEYEDVIQLGFVPEDDLISLIQGSDAIVLPSIHEGFGLPLLGLNVHAACMFFPAAGGNPHLCLTPPYHIPESTGSTPRIMVLFGVVACL